MGLTIDKIELAIDEIIKRLEVIENKLNINNDLNDMSNSSTQLYDFVSYGDCNGEIMHGQGTVITKYEIVNVNDESYFKVKVLKNLPNTAYVGMYFLIESTAAVGKNIYRLYSIVNNNPTEVRAENIWVKISRHID